MTTWFLSGLDWNVLLVLWKDQNQMDRDQNLLQSFSITETGFHPSLFKCFMIALIWKWFFSNQGMCDMVLCMIQKKKSFLHNSTKAKANDGIIDMENVKKNIKSLIDQILRISIGPKLVKISGVKQTTIACPIWHLNPNVKLCATCYKLRHLTLKERRRYRTDNDVSRYSKLQCLYRKNSGWENMSTHSPSKPLTVWQLFPVSRLTSGWSHTLRSCSVCQ